MYRYSLEERVFIVKTYWITGSINCQRRFVEQFGGRNPPLKRCIQLLVKKLILSFCVANFLFANSTLVDSPAREMGHTHTQTKKDGSTDDVVSGLY
jgi:hypothetical protein